MKEKNVGSSFDSWLAEEEIEAEVTIAAIKRVLARQILQAMEAEGLSKVTMAGRMKTSRSALNRLLDPENEAVTLATLHKAARAIGRNLRLEIV